MTDHFQRNLHRELMATGIFKETYSEYNIKSYALISTPFTLHYAPYSGGYHGLFWMVSTRDAETIKILKEFKISIPYKIKRKARSSRVRRLTSKELSKPRKYASEVTLSNNEFLSVFMEMLPKFPDYIQEAFILYMHLFDLPHDDE